MLLEAAVFELIQVLGAKQIRQLERAQVWALGLLTCGSSPTTAPFMQVSEF
jgi:hypothetical protein